MKFLTVIVLAIAIYGAAESKPAVEVNIDGVVDGFLADLTVDADALGLSHLAIPDIDLEVGAAEVALTNVKVNNLELMVRDGEVIADLPSLTAGVTAEVHVEVGFEKPVEITADAEVKVLILPAEGSLDATITNLVAQVDVEITLLDENTFTATINKLTLGYAKIDVDLEVAGIEAELLSQIVSEVSSILESTLNDVVAVLKQGIVNTVLDGKTFSLGL